jgi:hypothetical protein
MQNVKVDTLDGQGCQIFLDKQNTKKYIKCPQNILHGKNIYQISVQYFKRA